MNLNINCDGGSRGNPGPGACAYVVTDDNRQTIHKSSRYLGNTTNNQAEYEGVLEALRYLVSNPELAKYKIHFWLDSLLVVNQLKGLYKIKDPTLYQKYQEIKKIISDLQLSNIEFSHIPRTQNALADSLVNQSLDSHT